MDRSLKIVLFSIGAILLFLVLISWLAPEPLDWTPSFKVKDKTPLGLYVLDKEIDALFDTKADRFKLPLKDYFDEDMFEDSLLLNECVLIINKEIKWSTADVDLLIRYIRAGNMAFVSSSLMPKALMDTLEIKALGLDFRPSWMSVTDTIKVALRDTSLSSVILRHTHGLTGSYFTSFDSSNVEILGYTSTFQDTFANFIAVKYGAGKIFLHLEPAAFTNYFLIQKEYYQYSQAVLSYIPADFYVTWVLNNQTTRADSDSPLRFILSQPALLWAWYILISGILLFVVFNIRRHQRPIPVIKRPVNTSVEFARTIGNLYYLEGNINNIMDKKIIYLLERIRSEYYISTDKLDETFTKVLCHRSGKDPKIVEYMVFLVNKHLNNDYTCTEADLIRLNTSIEKFYQ